MLKVAMILILFIFNPTYEGETFTARLLAHRPNLSEKFNYRPKEWV